MRTMRTLGTLVVIGGTVVLAYGCSAAGNAPIGTEATDASTTSPGDYGNAGDGGPSGPSAKTDSGLPTSGGGYVYDAGSTAKLPQGSACDPATADGDPQSTQPCGLCGTQLRICDVPDGGASPVWDIWGACNGEATGADACDSTKTYPDTTCGNCGTMPQVCGIDCHFEPAGTFDCDEPAGACHPTDQKFVLGASCTTVGQGREYTCGSTCTYGSPSDCEAPPPNPNQLTLSATVGGTVSGIFSLPASPQLPSIETNFDDSCPVTVDTSSFDTTSGVYVAINNTTSRSITVSLWDGPAASGSANNFDTVMAWYNTPLFPPADLTACGFANDDCGSPAAECLNTSGFTFWSALSGSEGATIPAGGVITVYVGMLEDTDHGSVKLYAKSEN